LVVGGRAPLATFGRRQARDERRRQTRSVRQGSQGDAVRGVQEEFQFRNLSGDPGTGLAVDGIFGPKTDAAVRGFQQALHQDISSVTVDRIVGPVTWRALVSGMLSF
jgi:peptidoglycan hydrolase-like protein with peptidoglycan-binding domain